MAKKVNVVKEEQQAHQVIKVFKVNMVCKVMMDKKVIKVKEELQVWRVIKVYKVQKVMMDKKVIKGYKVLKVIMVWKVNLVTMVRVWNWNRLQSVKHMIMVITYFQNPVKTTMIQCTSLKKHLSQLKHRIWI